MRCIKLILLAICVSGCKKYRAQVTIYKTPRFYLSDTSRESAQFLKFNEEFSDYPIYYIGRMTDTIKIGNRYYADHTPWVDNFELRYIRKYSNKTLSIYVDTAVKTNSPAEYLSDDPQIANDSTINYHSFLLTIRNISDSVIYMGRTFSVFFIHLEAKNQNGEWVKVDKPLSECHLCVSSQPTIILRPKEMIVSKVRRFTGNFKTDFRLAFGYENNIAYSNVFRDCIDDRFKYSIPN
jgi:hypothetical protein